MSVANSSDCDSALQAATSQLNLVELHYNLGNVLHQQGNLVEAAESYRQAIDLQPRFANAHLNLAIVLDEQGQQLTACSHYRQAIALQPNFVKAYNNLGCTLSRLKQLDAAIQIYQQAIGLEPNWATLHNNLGQALQNQGKISEAIESYQRAIELQPDFVLPHHNLGKLLQAQGYHAKAITFFQQAIQIDPTYLPAYSDCSASWVAQGQLKQALPYWQHAIEQQSQFVTAYCQWTTQLDNRTTPSEAANLETNQEIDQLTQARIACGKFLYTLQHHPNSPELYEHLTQTYLHLAHTLSIYGGIAQHQQAQIYYQRVLQLQPHHLEAYLGLGECLVKQGKLSAAILTLHLALVVVPNPVPLHVQLGQMLEKQKQFAEAIVHYRHALQGDLSDRLTRSPLRQWKDENIASELLPLGLYRSTQAWVTATELDSTHYIPIQVSDSGENVVLERVSPDALPACALSLPIPPNPDSSTCQGLNCQPCLKQIFDRLPLLHLGKGIYRLTTDELATHPLDTNQLPFNEQPFNQPSLNELAGASLFVATIPHGSVWTVPQQNHWLVCNAIAVFTADRYLLADLSRSYPGQLPGCQHPEPSHHPIFQLEDLPTQEKITGTVAVLTGLSGHNYYHWMIDVLPRIALLQASGLRLNYIDWFLVNSKCYPFQSATLEALGVPCQKVIASDRHTHIQADQLVVPSFPDALGWPAPWALAFLRQQFLPLVERSTLSTPFPERIYISRTTASHRRVLNEVEVIRQLESHGFVSIQLESLSFVDQIALFANARIIVAPHGGGLTNMIFCRAKTTIIELANPHYIRHYFLIISQQLQLKHYLISGEVFACHPIRQLMYPSSLVEDLWINLESLVKLLQTLEK